MSFSVDVLANIAIELQRGIGHQDRFQRLITTLCILGGIAVMLVSVVLSLLIFNPFQKEPEYTAPISTPMPGRSGISM